MLFLFLSLISGKLHATHLMGGDITYTYLGPVSGGYSYRITITMYRDCYNSTTPFDQTINVGIYFNDVTRSLLRVENIDLTSEVSVDPPSGGSNCSFKPNVCIRRGYYLKTITLPATTTGFHLLHQRCCRNNLTNLIYNIGQSYYCFIPANSYQDRSPVFSGIPTPYLCANDTISISYGAYDQDGDSLVYTLVHPWAGGSDNNPAPYPSSNLSLPLPTVQYASGYGFSSPFGPAGYVNINSQTGLVTLNVPIAGLFAFAVEVRSYRNGQLLTVIRRDIELIVLNCPPNALPRLIYPNYTSYIIEEGQLLNFNLRYDDKDSMYLTRSGIVFDNGGSVPPPLALMNEAKGIDSVKTTFSWQTSCSHGSNSPYFFTVRVQDKGCPSKTTTTIFQVRVKPFVGPDSISGPKVVCEFDKPDTYFVHTKYLNSTFFWQVSGGTILSGQGSNKIIVAWGIAGGGTVRVSETSQYGCGPEMKQISVLINPLPVIDAGNDAVLCSRDTLQLGKEGFDNSYMYRWWPKLDLSDSTVARPFFTLRNVGKVPITRKYYLSAQNKEGCISFDSITIIVNPEPDTLKITGALYPCYAGTFTYEVSNEPSSYYLWTIEGGNKVSGFNSNKIQIHWTDTVSGKIKALEINSYQCLGDTAELSVTIIKPVNKIFGSPVVCPNSVNVEYWVKYREGSTYSWAIDKGGYITGPLPNTSNLIKVNWGDSGTSTISVIETTKEGCISEKVDYPVIISYHLQTSEIFGDTFVCAFSNENYSVNNTNGSNYEWSSTGGDILSGNGNNLINVSWGDKGSGMLKVLETSYDSVNDKWCIGDTVYQPVVINPFPETSPINGDPDVCENDEILYFLHGYPGSTFFWEVDSAFSLKGQGNDSIIVSWKKKGIYQIRVRELSKDSCFGDIVQKFITVHPLPVASVIIGDSTICYPRNTGINYTVKGYPNSTYQWTVSGGKIIGPAMSSSVIVDWYANRYGLISTIETSEWGCIGPALSKNIILDSLAPEIKLVTTSPENDLIMEVYWNIVNDFHYNRKTVLYREKASRRSWITVDSFPKEIMDYIDKNVSTHEYSYRYQIAVSNVCSDEFRSTPHQSILLSGEKVNSFDISLKWNPYAGWKEGVGKYEIYRSTNEDAVYRLYKSGFKDSIAYFEVGLDGAYQCFRTVAVNKNNPNLKSWSNSVCFEFEPVLHVPNAFTPNNDGVNDTFLVYARNMYTFQMEIYNRWGELIFLSTDPYKGWDGTFEGKPCPPDAYLLLVKYTGIVPTHTYKGNITLIR